MSAQTLGGAGVSLGAGLPGKSSSAASGRGRGRQSQALQRRVEALQLRQAGLTYRQVGARLGMTESGARKAVLKALHEVQREKARQVLEVELARLDRLQVGVWPRALAGDLRATNTLLLIMDRRAKYLGLNNPRVTDAATDTMTLLTAMARQLQTGQDTYVMTTDDDPTTETAGERSASHDLSGGGAAR